LGGCFFIVLVVIGCIGLAYSTSMIAARNLRALTSRTKSGEPQDSDLLGLLLFLCQLVMILATWPAFGIIVRMLESMGYGIKGWS
jgi:Ca2+/Na+ antiporter